jgi:hypothetical protein
MTYSLAAPLLYKEVVVGDFSKFFFGLDEPQSEHSSDSEESLPGQIRICCSSQSGGRPYECPQHSGSNSDIEEEKTGQPLSTSIQSKQGLLGLVKALHLVYTPQDHEVFSNVRVDEFECKSNGEIREHFFPRWSTYSDRRTYPILSSTTRRAIYMNFPGSVA